MRARRVGRVCVREECKKRRRAHEKKKEGEGGIKDGGPDEGKQDNGGDGGIV